MNGAYALLLFIMLYLVFLVFASLRVLHIKEGYTYSDVGVYVTNVAMHTSFIFASQAKLNAGELRGFFLFVGHSAYITKLNFFVRHKKMSKVIKAFRPVVFIQPDKIEKEQAVSKTKRADNQVIYFFWPYLALLDPFPCFFFVLKLQVDKGLTQLQYIYLFYK